MPKEAEASESDLPVKSLTPNAKIILRILFKPTCLQDRVGKGKIRLQATLVQMLIVKGWVAGCNNKITNHRTAEVSDLTFNNSKVNLV